MFGRRRLELQEQAKVAKGEAAVAFFQMDEGQRQVTERLTFAAHVDGGQRGQALLDRVRPEAAEADAAAAEWLALGEGADPEQELDADAYERTAAAYAKARDRLNAAREALERVLLELGPELDAIESALAAVPPRVEAARQAIREAEAAVAALRSAGLPPAAAEEVLARVRGRAQVLDEGAAVHGITATLAAANEVAGLAAEARRRAEELPRQRDDTARRLVSVRTRLEAASGKSARLDSGLSALRRGYVENSWRDLSDAPARFAAALKEAAGSLAEADAASRRLAYPDALRLLEGARGALTRADEQVRLVTERLSTLDSLQADPRAQLAPVQFALKDAQRLLMADGRPDPVRVRELDALVARLEKLPGLLERAHPDYFGFLQEVDAIKAGVAAAVETIRASRRGR